MKTKRDLSLYCGPSWPFHVPAGTAVEVCEKRPHLYCVPRDEAVRLGVDPFDADHRYMFVSPEEVES